MGNKDDFEDLYAGVLKECISLVESIAKFEQEQISLSLQIGKKVSNLINNTADSEAIFKKLSRDIFIARGKMISPLKLSEYQQLYLTFETVERFESMSNGLLNDITAETLSKLAKKNEEPAEETGAKNNPLISVLKKAEKLLNRFETLSEDYQFDNEEMAEVIRNLEVIQNRTNCFLENIKSGDRRFQLDLFPVNYNGDLAGVKLLTPVNDGPAHH